MSKRKTTVPVVFEYADDDDREDRPRVVDGKFTEHAPYQRVFQADEMQWRKGEKDFELSFSASSDAPVERWFGTEVLSHETKAVKLDRARNGAMPLLLNHNIDAPIGMIRSARLEKNRLMVNAQFFSTDRAKEVQTMIDGGLRNVSIAYRIGEIVEDKKGETFTVTDWEPYEVSIVSVPADASVGIGRHAMNYEVRMVRASQPVSDDTKTPIKEGRMSENHEEAVAKTEPSSKTAVAVAETQIDGVRGQTALEIEQARRRAIQKFGKAFKMSESMVNAWIEQGYSLEEVSNDVLKTFEERGERNPQPASRLGLSAAETERYSLLRAIRGCSQRTWQKDAPYELEVSKAIAQRLGKVVDENTFYVPFEYLQRSVDQQMIEMMRSFYPANRIGLSLRDLTVAAAGQGGYLVGTENQGFVEMLRNRSVAYRMGARRMSGLTGNVTIPRQSAAATAFWLATEATPITESQQTFVQISLLPKTVGGYVEISRLLLLQSSPGAEGIVTNDLSAVLATAVDLAVLNGSGAAGQPLGIIGTAGIGGVTGTTLAYAGILEFQVDVATANVTPARGGYITTPAVAALMMARSRFSNTDTPLWQGNIWDGTMAGFPAMSSNQVPSANMLFGDWNEVVVGEWGVLEVTVNPFANFAAGIIGVRAMYTVDVAVQRPFAFSLATTIT